MKKTYIAPSMEVIKVGATSMMASSFKMNDETVDTSNGGQLGREDNSSSRPGIWEQGW